MYCGRCGKELKEDANFCTNCGNIVVKKVEKVVVNEEKIETVEKEVEQIHFANLGMIEKIMFVLAIVAMVTTVIPLSYGFIYFATILSVIVLGIVIYLYTKKKIVFTRISIILASLALVTNLLWIYYGIICTK